MKEFRRPSRALAVCALAVAGLVAPACVEAPPPGTIYAAYAPPVAEVEVVGTAPGPDFVWIAGHHVWRENAYHWEAGRWERRPHADAHWIAGSWKHHHDGWYWRNGYWK